MHGRFMALQRPSQMVYSCSATGGVRNHVFLSVASQVSVCSFFPHAKSAPSSIETHAEAETETYAKVRIEIGLSVTCYQFSQ